MIASEPSKAGSSTQISRLPYRQALRQTDILLLPLLTFAFGLQFYDKAVLGSASIFGILEALQLQVVHPTTGARDLSRYSLATACFYYGYIAAVIPMALLAQRFKIAYFLGSCILIWGVIVLLTPVVTTWQGLCVQRVFLGMIESAVSPGFILVTRQWYTKAEMPLRVGVWYSATGLFSILSGLISYGIGVHHKGGLATWKVLFLVPGAMTVFFGLAVMTLLPNSPTEQPLLRIPGYNAFSAERQSAVAAKTKQEMLGRQRTSSNWRQVGEALIDPKTWIYTVMATTIYCANAGVPFGPIIIKSMGYSSTRAILLQTPGGAATVVAIAVVCIASVRFKQGRLFLLALSCLPVLIGAAMIWGSSWQNKAIPLAGYYLIPIFGAPYVMLLASAAANVAGSTKSTFTSGAIFVGYNAGNIASAYILKPSEAAQHYPTTWKIIIAMMVVTMGLSGVLALLFAWENSKRSKTEATGLVDRQTKQADEHDEDMRRKSADMDSMEERIRLNDENLTDWQNKHFRYVF